MKSLPDQSSCPLCGQTTGHSARCSVTRHGVDEGRLVRVSYDTMDRWARGRQTLEAEIERLKDLIEQARDLVAQAYSDDEDNDSPGNMAFAVLNAALESGAADEEQACDFCGQIEGHSKRCSVTKFGVNPKPPHTPASREEGQDG